MTVYNDERYVGAAIDSILRQQFRNFEFIIIDDGSIDATPTALQGAAAKDQRIRVHRQENQGTTAAANKGLGLARGEFVARLDSDDLSFPHRLATEVDYLDKNPGVGLVGGGCEVIDRDGLVIGTRNILSEEPAAALRHRCIFQQSDVMFRRNIAVGLGGYRSKFRNAQDYDLWLRLSEVTQIGKLPALLGQWRLNGGGYTLARAREQRMEVAVIRRFAQRRRAGLPDGYETYAPHPAVAHRREVRPEDYDRIAGLVLLQALRTREARARFSRGLRSCASIRTAAFYAAAWLPRPFLRGGFAIRNLWLNRFQ